MRSLITILLFVSCSFSLAAPNSEWSKNQIESLRSHTFATTKRQVTVAVIDTGIDPLHPALQTNLWINPGESGYDSQGRSKRTNGIDDDKNGFVDDVYGWNFVDNNPDIRDLHGHGTHIAGIIGARGRHSGVAPHVKLMALKYFSHRGNGLSNLRNTIKALRYAVRMRVDIINYSGGGITPSPEEQRWLRKARSLGILVVAAAGNEHSNADHQPYYPANYPLDNIVSVAAVDPHKKILKTSNYGPRSVDIAAPGLEILSTWPGGEYRHMTGTSQATAFVTGVAALILAESKRTPKQVIEQLTHSGLYQESLQKKLRQPVILNSYRALTMKSDQSLPQPHPTRWMQSLSHLLTQDSDPVSTP